MPVTFQEVYEAYDAVVDAVTGFEPATEVITPNNQPRGKADKTYSIEMRVTPETERWREYGRCRATVIVRWLRAIKNKDHPTILKESWTDALNVLRALMDASDDNLAELAQGFGGTDVSYPGGTREWLLVTQTYTSDFYISLTA